MWSLFLVAALSASSIAKPLPQGLDLDMVIAAPDPTYTQAVGATAQVVNYDIKSIVAAATSVTSVAASSDLVAEPTAAPSLAKRGNCAAQPVGATGAPLVSPDTPAAFVANTAFAAAASSAPTPPGYDNVFTNLNASNSAYGYLGYTNLQKYDTNACAAKCNAIAGCQAINIYFERDPSQDPGPNCQSPSSVTYVKCVFWGGPVSASNANNVGQFRQNFQVVMAGSNGYVSKAIPTVAGYTGPQYLGNAAIDALYDSQGYYTYMGVKIFTSGPFNASLCADYCTAQNVYNLAHPPTDGSPVQTCQFFNTYLLYINQTSYSQGQMCAIYSEAWGPSYGTNTGQYRGPDHYMIYNSFTYTNSTGMISPNKNGAIHQASKEIIASSLQPYCSTILGFTTPLTTTTVTATSTAMATITATITTTALATTTPTEITTVTSYTTIIVTGGNRKREVANATTSFITLLDMTAYPDHMLPTIAAMMPKRAISISTPAAAVSTPAALTKYPATVVSSACSLVATPVTSTSTITVVQSTTITQTATISQTDTSTITSTADTSYSTTTVVVTQTATVPPPRQKARSCADALVFQGTDVGKCSYLESCGQLIAPMNCVYDLGGTQPSAGACAESCDAFSNCGGANYNDNGQCILCSTDDYTGTKTGDGSAGSVALVRQYGSCQGVGGYF